MWYLHLCLRYSAFCSRFACLAARTKARTAMTRALKMRTMARMKAQRTWHWPTRYLSASLPHVLWTISSSHPLGYMMQPRAIHTPKIMLYWHQFIIPYKSLFTYYWLLSKCVVILKSNLGPDLSSFLINF